MSNNPVKEPNIFREKRDKDHPYAVISKVCLNDKSLSWGAKGMLAYLLSLPDDWKINMDHLSNQSSDKRDSTSSIMQELIKAGYILRSPQRRNSSGKFDGEYQYVIYESKKLVDSKGFIPKADNPSTVKPKTGKPSTDNPSMVKPKTDNPLTDIPSTGEPSTGNQPLLNNNLLNSDSNQILSELSTKDLLNNEKQLSNDENKKFILETEIVQLINKMLPSRYQWSGLIPEKDREKVIKLCSFIGKPGIEAYSKWFIEEKLEDPSSGINSFNWGIFTHKNIWTEYKKYQKEEAERDSYLKTTSKWKAREPSIVKKNLELLRHLVEIGSVITQEEFKEIEAKEMKKFEEWGIDYNSVKISS